MATATVLTHNREIAFGPYGGAELFFADIDGDGQQEILAYQGPGVFGTGLLRHIPHVAAAYPQSTCLSAFRADGTRMWTYGEPNPVDSPYICHAHESCVATGDVDNDGVVEVAMATGDAIHVLDGPTGRLKGTASLPEDNFFIVQILGEPTSPGEAAIVTKNGENGYGQWQYGEPVVGIGTDLRPVWTMAVPGGGHHILVLDLDRDGHSEFLIGYCTVTPSGRCRCVVDGVDSESVDASSAHVDYTDIRQLRDGSLVLGIAGSDKAYLVTETGKTLFVKPDTHVQGAALGRFRDDTEYQLAIYNDDGPMVLYAPTGKELWRVSTSDKEQWPLGMPDAARGRTFHRNRPITTLPGPSDTILFSDGGWPWAMDGYGDISVQFAPPENSRQPEAILPPQARADDMGYGFGAKVVDWEGNGQPAAVIYDRGHLWSFPCS